MLRRKIKVEAGKMRIRNGEKAREGLGKNSRGGLQSLESICTPGIPFLNDMKKILKKNLQGVIGYLKFATVLKDNFLGVAIEAFEGNAQAPKVGVPSRSIS